MASDQSSPPTSAAEALEHLGSLSLRKVSMEYLLQTVADLTKAVMHGNPEASVTLLVKDHPTTVATTGRLALDLDEKQYERGHGPCLHAARTGELTEIADMRTDSRWPDYSPRAAESGALSSLSVPLAIDDDEQVTGAINIYAREPDAFDEASRTAATHFGPYAAVAAGDLHAFHSARARADNLQAALATRGVIDQAKGILMDRHKLTADQAFQVLAQTSMKTNRKLYAVADDLVHTGDPPGELVRTARLTRPSTARVARARTPPETHEQPQRLPRGQLRSGPAAPAQGTAGPPLR
ncbi:GAF domain-containing protein [Geodermatophilus obscurus]|uniref:GAF domain-containing protein n=1 Tax=Geodermatophilus obscurus TaxID=1861 RepID=A0A1M7SJI5_9ACTN|nr:GAF domain-containing protein [Geodermatophilus obscurus]